MEGLCACVCDSPQRDELLAAGIASLNFTQCLAFSDTWLLNGGGGILTMVTSEVVISGVNACFFFLYMTSSAFQNEIQ